MAIPGGLAAPRVTLPEPAAGEQWVAGAIVLDGHGRAFVQRRSHDRALYPGCWDIAGGHVEPGETLVAALAREITEETGWVLRRVCRLLGVHRWSAPVSPPKLEADFVVDVAGDLGQPQLEWDKHPEYTWAGRDGLDLLLENRRPGDTFVRDLVARAVAGPPGR